jgi:eukaryotic-like serine/threonine-protein kinase
LLAISPERGKRLWSVKSDVRTLLAADSDAAYFVTSQGEYRAVGFKPRRVLWTVPAPVPSSKRAPAKAVVGGGRLVVSGSDGAVAALDTRTGKKAWPQQRAKQARKPLLPAVAQGVVYLGGTSLTALDLADGEEKWSQPSVSFGSEDSEGWTAPAVSGGYVYAADGIELQQRKATDGSPSWTCRLDYDIPPLDPPTVQGHSVWIGLDRTGAAGIATVRTNNGSEAWLHSANVGGEQQMTAAGNRVFVLREGELTAMPVF